MSEIGKLLLNAVVLYVFDAVKRGIRRRSEPISSRETRGGSSERDVQQSRRRKP